MGGHESNVEHEECTCALAAVIGRFFEPALLGSFSRAWMSINDHASWGRVVKRTRSPQGAHPSRKLIVSFRNRGYHP